MLGRNWTGTSTIPAAGLYPHQWNWDTGFIAIGHARYDQARAEDFSWTAALYLDLCADCDEFSA